MALAVIAKAARGGQWQAAGWLLERRYGYKRASELHVVDATEGKERDSRVSGYRQAAEKAKVDP